MRRGGGFLCRIRLEEGCGKEREKMKWKKGKGRCDEVIFGVLLVEGVSKVQVADL